MMKRFLKAARYIGIAIVSLGLLAAAWGAFESNRSKRAWESYRREAAAQGIQLDFSTRSPIPEADNFISTPLFKKLFEGAQNETAGYQKELEKRLSFNRDSKAKPPAASWVEGERTPLEQWATYFGNADILEALRKFDPELAEISEAAKRPKLRFLLGSTETEFPKGFSCFSSLRSLAQLYRLRGAAALAQGQTDLALADTETLLQMAGALSRSDNFLGEILFTPALIMPGLQIVWEGVERNQWSKDQLVRLQNLLQGIDLLEMKRRAVQLERAFFNHRIEEEPCIFSKTFLHRLQKHWVLLEVNRAYDRDISSMIDPGRHRVYLKPKAETEPPTGLSSYFKAGELMIHQAISTFQKTNLSIASTQVYLDEAVISCALERFRIDHGKYPSQLEALVPQYLVRLPHDVISGEPLKYRLKDEGGYFLYSMGANGTDEGGQVVMKKEGCKGPDLEQGDWVWKIPSSPSAIQ